MTYFLALVILSPYHTAVVLSTFSKISQNGLKLSENRMDVVDTYYDLRKNPATGHGREGYSRTLSMFKRLSRPSRPKIRLSD